MLHLPRRRGALGSSADTLAVAADGSLYVGGLADGVVDLDPGSGTATRALPGNDGNNGGFVVKLGADGSLGWARTLTRVPAVSVIATADSGVVAGGESFLDGQITGLFVTKIGADGTAVWSMATGANVALWGLAASASGFLVVGATDVAAADVVPGAAINVVPAGSVFVSCYAP